MQTGNISFCEKTALNIKSDNTKKQILQNIEDKYGIKVLKKHFENFDESSSISKLQKNPYLMCLKSNGNPYFMLLTRINEINTCILIDKKIQQGYFLPRMIVIHKQFSDKLFNDTIIDGEMIKDKNENWVYLINDMFVYCGKKLDDLNFIKRVNILYDLLENHYKKGHLDIFAMQIKKYFKCSDLHSEMLPFRNIVPYSSRGIIFKPMFYKFKDILYNFDNSLIVSTKKVKRLGKTNEFIMSDTKTFNTNINQSKFNVSENKQFIIKSTNTPDIYVLHDIKTNDIVGNACVNNLNTSKFLNTLFENSSLNTSFHVNCKLNPKFNKWIPISKC
tara:strand:+ start:2358 stop:3353 length:996 start_codon:yes stop_codon:yes gene_type:complete